MMSESLKFGSVALNKDLVHLLNELGFETMSPVQEKCIPLLLKNKSVLGLAPTGTGKTLAYALPILNDLKNDGHVQAVILSPTVALMSQIKSVFSVFLERMGFAQDAIKAVYSNNDFNRSKPVILLITPELYRQALSRYPIDELTRVIIDEGDMVAFDGFKDALEALKKQREKHQISFFSASLNVQDITRVKSRFLIDEVVDVRKSITNKTVTHHAVNIKSTPRAEALCTFLDYYHPFKTIAFVSSKEELVKFSLELKALGRHFLLVHGGLDKRDIKKALDAFRKDNEPLLIASDYVSRGLDIDSVDDVVSIDLPKDLQYYFHRAGRAGRFETPGESFVFYTEDNPDSLKKVSDLVRRGVKFVPHSITKEGIKDNKGTYEFRNLGKKDTADSEVVQKQIRHVVNQVKSKKVKPGYKKKVQKAVELVKFKHRKKVVLTNIAKNGGNARDFHMDMPTGKGKKK